MRSLSLLCSLCHELNPKSLMPNRTPIPTDFGLDGDRNAVTATQTLHIHAFLPYSYVCTAIFTMHKSCVQPKCYHLLNANGFLMSSCISFCFKYSLQIRRLYTSSCAAVTMQCLVRSYFVISCHCTSSYLALYFLLSPSPGVIATHRITASSPDTDLPTVSSLRVRRQVSALLCEKGK